MKRIAALILMLTLFVMPLAAQATSLSDLVEQPEPTPRPMPEPTVVNIPQYNNNSPDQFLGRILLPNDTAGLGYEFSSFSSEPWEQTQQLINYNNRLIEAGYDDPSFNEFEGENMQYLSFDANDKAKVYLLPNLKENAMITVIRYDDVVLEAFPEDVSAEDAYAALIAELGSEETMDTAAGKLAAIWKTPDMAQAVTDQITAENMDILLPTLIQKDYYTRFEDNGEVNVSSSVTRICEVLYHIINMQETTEGKLSLAKRAAESIVPVVDERYLQISSLVRNTSDMQSSDVTDRLPAIPAFDSGAEIPEDLSDDGAAHKYVIVGEMNECYKLMPYHSVFLPVGEIAESIEEADRIIVCHNYYKKSSGNWIGGTPSDSMTRINLYDAKDGSLICNIGSAANYQGMVSHGGIPHDWIEMGEVIRGYFEEK